MEKHKLLEVEVWDVMNSISCPQYIVVHAYIVLLLVLLLIEIKQNVQCELDFILKHKHVDSQPQGM